MAAASDCRISSAAAGRAVRSPCGSTWRAAAPVATHAKIAAIGMEPVGNAPGEFKLFVERAIKRYAEIVKIAGIQAE